ncbi:MAG TPA: ComEC/Rec2 family competence protein [Anaerolineales bacterium]|jgi:competence protein ComEC|nr:ComEC/Rec2 family competence protein [Anaerolineales bacterium]HQX15623.1 ComEC/Rec2 family competence protein [Anaerolineales bacterium]
MQTSTLSRAQAYLSTHLPLVWVSLAFLGGIALARYLSLPIWIWFGLALLFILLAILARIIITRLHHSPFLSPFSFILFASLFLGSARYQYSVPNFDAFHIAFYNDRNYDLLMTGYLIEPPDYRDSYTNLRLQVTAVDTGDGDLEADGLLLARVDANQVFHYGEIIRLRGKLKTPPENEDFSYRDYLAAQNIHSYMSNAEVTVLPGNGGNIFSAALYALKEKSLANIYRIFPDPESSLLAGILLGVDTGLTKELQGAFKNTGTAHIIAISGFNISIIAGIFFTLFSRFFGPRWGSALAVFGIIFYTLLVGGDAAVVRAAIMGTFALFARQIGRRQFAMNTLLAVAMLMCAWNPLYIWDVGFQLSFFATLGLILYAEPFSQAASNLLHRFLGATTVEKITQPLSDFVLLTFAAQLTTIPIMAYHFQRISLVSFLANPFILPAQPAVMILGGVAALLSLIWLPLGQLAAWVAYPFALYTIRVVELFDRIPRGTIFLGDFSFVFVLLFYIALLSLTFNWSALREWIHTLRAKAGTLGAGSAIVLLTIALLLVWRAASSVPDRLLHITFLDVGSADAVLIKTPTGKNILINGGPSVTILSDELGRRVSAFDRSLDWLIVANTDEEQVASLPRALERYKPDNVLWSGNRQGSFSSRVLYEYLTLQAIPVTFAETNHTLDLGDGATLRALTTGARGSVLLIEWQNFRAVLPIGMSFEAIAELRDGLSVGPVSALSLADSGYAPSNPPEWIVNLNPELIVLNVAAGDENGMPDDETLVAIQDHELLRTDQNGWIEITTNGEQMWVNVERNRGE